LRRWPPLGTTLGQSVLEGSGKALRFIRLHTPADADRPVVKRLVRKAFRLGGIATRRDDR